MSDQPALFGDDPEPAEPIPYGDTFGGLTSAIRRLNDEATRRVDELERARAKRDAGMAAAEDHADAEWKQLAADTLAVYLRTHAEFFVDDFWTVTELEAPREARALGPIILAAARAGRIVKTGEYRPSVRSNLTPKPVWRSTVYQP